MTSNQTNDSNKLTPESLPEEIRKAYQPPTLTLLDDYHIASGSLNVPENSNGLLS